VTAVNFRDSVRTLLRDRLLDAAASITSADGWGSVTMSKIADEVGVSRQTVYNELGSKPEIAQELVMRELGRFLDVVRERINGESDVVEAIRSACEGALETAESNPLLKVVLDSVQGGATELLPLLTTESQGLIDVASTTVMSTITERFGDIGLSDQRFAEAVDAIVRLVLSHAMRPAKSLSEAASEIAWIADHVIRGAQRH